MLGANVRSIQAIKDAKAALADFIDTCTASLASVDAEIQHIGQWLSHDRAAHWKHEVRRREDALKIAKGEVMRKQLIAAPEPASVVEERKRVQRCKDRLESAQRKLEAVRRWLPVWEREAELYKGACAALNESIVGSLPIAMARLERFIDSLEAYAKIAPPSDTGQAPPEAPATPDTPEEHA